MKDLYNKIDIKIQELNELYDYYLDKIDNEVNNKDYYQTRLREIRCETGAYLNVLDMILIKIKEELEEVDE